MAEIVAAVVAGLQQVVAPPTVFYLCAGAIIGFVVGVLPGLGSPAALALLLPALIQLAPIDAFVLVIATAAVSSAAGDLTSILLGVPGEATAAAVVPDGHALMKQGQGGRASGAAIASALLGSLIGALVLVAFVPVAPALLLRMQSPELAALAVLGICLLVPLSKADALRGFLSGALGLALATVGLDPTLGEPRFTFGLLSLWDGLGLLPLALGIFAVPEVLATLRNPTRFTSAAHGGRHGLLAGCREALRHGALLIRCSAIGAAIGVLPGVGGAVAQWIAYGHASHSSRSRVAFGSGAIEGVIGPATATTATLGGALVPTLALGIPGSLATSFLLSAMLFKGVTPGPAMLQPEHAGGHLSLVYALVWTVAIASAIGAVLAVASIGWVARLAAVRPERLFPTVVTLVLVGTIGERHAVSDVAILLVLGGVGYAMAANGWPRPPLILGFVLGPFLERRLLLSQSLYGWTWLVRPGVLLLAAVAAAFLVVVLRAHRARTAGRPPRRPLGQGDLAMSAAALVVSGLGTWASLSLPVQSRFFPSLAFGLALALAAILVGLSWRHPVRLDALRPSTATQLRFGWLLVFALDAWLLGLIPGTVVSSLAFLGLEARAPWRVALATTAALAVTVALIVTRLLHLDDRGVLGTLLGG